MATKGYKASQANFSTTPYNYQEGSAFGADIWYWFYKSNVCWDVYISSGSYGLCRIRLDFYDYDRGIWIPYESDAGTYAGYGYQYTTYQSNDNTFRFFHNCLRNYDNGAYTAYIKLKDKLSLYDGTYTYDTRGFSLWRIGFCFTRQHSSHDFNINSYGPGYLYSSEYDAICYGKLICCGGKGDPDSDDQHIVSGSPSASDYNTRFLPSLFRGSQKIIASLDRQYIPYWGSFRT